MERLQRIQELLKNRQEIDSELDQIKKQVKEEKAAFASTRKPRKKVING